MSSRLRFAGGGSVLAFVAALLAASAVLGRGPSEGAPSSSDSSASESSAGAALPVEVVTLVSSDGYPVAESFAGRVVSRRDSQLGFERAGRLERVLVDEGDSVEAGAVLAALDTSALRAERRELDARRGETEARLALARVTTQRRRALHERGHLSPQRLDEAIYEESALAARLVAAQAAVDRVDVALDLSVIHAPFAGSVAQQHLDEGTIVSPGVPVLQLIEGGALEVRIGLPSESALTIEVGSRHGIDADGRRYEGRLSAVLGTVDPVTRTVTAIFRIDEPRAALRSGALARVTLAREMPGRGFWVPLTALTESRRGLWSTYVATPVADGVSGRVDRRQVDVIHAENDRAFVRGTLQDGDRLIATGLHRLVPGQLVRAVPGSEAGPPERTAQR
jgi:RND family efflux transporter MFP subunit